MAGLGAEMIGKGKKFEEKYGWKPKTQAEMNAVNSLLQVMEPAIEAMDYLKIPPVVGPNVPTIAAAMRGVDRAAVNLSGQQAAAAARKGATAAKNAVRDVAISDAMRDVLTNVQRRTGAAPLPIMAYQGSPHLYAATAKNPLGELDPTKIGSGEGAQAYGYGHYLAENPEVARGYRSSVSSQHGQDVTINGVPVDEYYMKVYNNADRLPAEEARQQYDKASLIEMLGFNRSPNEVLSYAEDMGYAPSVIDWFKSSVMPQTKMPGYLYTHDLSDEAIARMLDWDKPLSQQSQHVKDALERSDYALRDMAYDISGDKDPLGGSIARTAMGPKEFAEHMRSLGIPGIRYLDQNSKVQQAMDSSAVGGTRNFVLFPGEEEASKIIRREKTGGAVMMAKGGFLGALARTAERGLEKTVKAAPQDEALRLAQLRAALPTSQGGLGLPASNTPMDRAKAMEFDLDKNYVHNTSRPFDKIKENGKFSGIFSLPNYSANYGNVDMPLVVRGKIASSSDLKGSIKNPSKQKKMAINEELPSNIKDPADIADAYVEMQRRRNELARELGYTGVKMNDEFGDTVSLVSPENIRSRFAAFDPFRKDAATAALFGVAAPDLLAKEQEPEKELTIDEFLNRMKAR